MKKIAIIDYKLSNLFSVMNACRFVGLSPILTSDKREIMTSDAVILPGVGAFGDAMRNLQHLDLVHPIIDFVDSGKPFMGVCLGLQLLLTESEEFGTNKGLNLIQGTNKRFLNEKDKMTVKVPQIGWNQIFPPKTDARKWEYSPLSSIESGEYMYFVHSYYALPTDANDILTETNYGQQDYCSAVLKSNIFATQFHPEKSGKKGVQIYRKWAEKIK